MPEIFMYRLGSMFLTYIEEFKLEPAWDYYFAMNASTFSELIRKNGDEIWQYAGTGSKIRTFLSYTPMGYDGLVDINSNDIQLQRIGFLCAFSLSSPGTSFAVDLPMFQKSEVANGKALILRTEHKNRHTKSLKMLTNFIDNLV